MHTPSFPHGAPVGSGSSNKDHMGVKEAAVGGSLTQQARTWKHHGL